VSAETLLVGAATVIVFVVIATGFLILARALLRRRCRSMTSADPLPGPVRCQLDAHHCGSHSYVKATEAVVWR
jgi:hypothetical protein